MVQVRKGERNSLLRTDNLDDAKVTNCRTRATITRSMRGYRKERVQNILPNGSKRRSGQDGGRGQMSKTLNSGKRDGE